MKAVEEYILKRPVIQQELLGFLHQHFESLGLHSKLSYGIPFYYGKKWICYMNPLKDQKSIELCFPRAHQFADPTGLLQIRGRKQIKGIYLDGEADIPLEEIQKILEAALILDQSW